MKQTSVHNHIQPIRFNGSYFANKSLLARSYGVNPRTFLQRLRHGVPIVESLKSNRPPQKGLGCFFNGKVFNNIAELAHEYGVTPDALRSRIKNNWPLEEALELIPRKPKLDSRSLIVNNKKYRSIKEVSKSFGLDPDVVKNRFVQYGSIQAAVSPIFDLYASPLLLSTFKPVYFHRKIYPSMNALINSLINSGMITASSLAAFISALAEFTERVDFSSYASLGEMALSHSVPMPKSIASFNQFIDLLHQQVFGYQFDMLFHLHMNFILNCDEFVFSFLGKANLATSPLYKI
ncbi:hypothetical protein [Shewanella aestuarii]|uniref:Uncharacterized protein n=1 Tax=Shewanella aestuarii TaxID=1028752 RepID=A0A6G9QPW7_9GAMM|nr:hypothetical protein [Shewanella aestuarii]QIR16606.1 hypothetical protein HBH39_19210 [Shewanella aestuarii]